MRAVMATANLVGFEALDNSQTMTAVLPRSDLEAAAHADDPLGLWFDVAEESHDEALRLSVEMSSADVRDALRQSTGGEIVLAVDAKPLAELYGDSEVEAHGMRGALAIAVTVAAVAAPTGVGANREVASTAMKPDIARTAMNPQVARTDLTRQVMRTALKPQVAHVALKPQVAHVAWAGRTSHLVITAAGVNHVL
jgi:hypothetical protein